MKMEKLYEYCNGNRMEISIPEGFHVEKGNIDNGLVIQNERGDSFTRIPPGYTADGLYVSGFWISTYLISKGNNGEARSVCGKYPWTNINFYEADIVARNFGGKLISKEEYNRVCMWLVQTHAATFEQVFINGVDRGNYNNPVKLQMCGSNPKWLVNNIDCFWGNAFIWTTQLSELYDHYRIVRGGISKIYKTEIYWPPSSKAWAVPEKGGPMIGFRIVLY